MKKWKILTFLFLIIVSFITFMPLAKAYENNEVYLGGDNIGIKVNTGISVVGKYEVETISGKLKPWKNSDIEVNDQIISLENIKVSDNLSLINILSKINKEEIKMIILRNNKKIETTIKVVKTKNNQKSLGLYLKDKVMGIGTLTFVDPRTNKFASLGHGIYQENKLLNTNSGVILDSNVDSIKKGIPGDAGEIRSTINNKVLGYIDNNLETGLYGQVVNNQLQGRQLIEVADVSEVKLGEGYIITTIEDDKPKKYKIEIIDLEEQTSSNIKGIKIKIVDPELLSITGGIVQGMSGSPIVQNNKLVGAVSHVIVDNPSYGYGMYAVWMLNDANKN